MKLKQYGGCAKKRTARRDTIISPYQDLFGNRLPDGKQYWTMCATHVDADGGLLAGSELDQMVEEGLVQSEQFHGVDIEADIIEGNRAAVPQAHWHHADFYDAMARAWNEGWFNPGIVNCDTVWTPATASGYAAKILTLLSGVRNVLVAVNTVLRCYGHETTVEEAVRAFADHRDVRYALRRGWASGPGLYRYNGTGNNKTVMGTVLFHRSSHRVPLPAA